jgi:hypothetical protein
MGPGNHAVVTGDGMEELMILRTFAAVTTVPAAVLVAANLNARITVAGFVTLLLPPSPGWPTAGLKQGLAGHPERHPPPDQRARSLAAGFRRPRRRRRS